MYYIYFHPNRLLRDKILEGDFACNVKLLQNFPPMDINIVLSKAVALRKIS